MSSFVPGAVNNSREGLAAYYCQKGDQLEVIVKEKEADLRRLEAQRNEWNQKGTLK